MFCPDCGAENKSSAAFCEQCGLPLKVTSGVSTHEKPLGIVVISILAVLSGIGELIAGGMIAFVPHLMGFVANMAGEGISASDHIASLKIAGMAAVLSISGVLNLATAYGLWNFIGWGRVLAVFLNSLGLLVGVVLFLTTLDASQSAGSIALQLLAFAATIWILIYLFRANIRELFHIEVDMRSPLRRSTIKS